MVKNNSHITMIIITIINTIFFFLIFWRTITQGITYTLPKCTHLCANPNAIALISLLGRPAKKEDKIEALMSSTGNIG